MTSTLRNQLTATELIGPLSVYWFVVFVGTAVAGALFGLLDSGLVGLRAGFWFALFVAIPVIPTVALSAWALLLSRYRIAVAGTAGAATGALAVVVLLGDATVLRLQFPQAVLLAAAIGALGAGCAARLLCLSDTETGRVLRHDAQRFAPQFTLRSLFVRILVLTRLVDKRPPVQVGPDPTHQGVGVAFAADAYARLFRAFAARLNKWLVRHRIPFAKAKSAVVFRTCGS